MPTYLLLRLAAALLTFSLGLGLTSLWPASKYQQTVFTSDNALVSELLRVEEDWHIARMANDQATLERLTADEFINIDQYGQRTTKSEYIGFIMQERYARQSYSYNNARLLISDGNTAIMELDKVWCDSVHKVHFRDIDTFVRQQDGQWKVTASDSASYPFWVE